MEPVPVPLAMKIGSALIHAAEYIQTGHTVDRLAFDTAMSDLEVAAWIQEWTAGGLLPVLREPRYATVLVCTSCEKPVGETLVWKVHPFDVEGISAGAGHPLKTPWHPECYREAVRDV